MGVWVAEARQEGKEDRSGGLTKLACLLRWFVHQRFQLFNSPSPEDYGARGQPHCSTNVAQPRGSAYLSLFCYHLLVQMSICLFRRRVAVPLFLFEHDSNVRKRIRNSAIGGWKVVVGE